MQGDLGGGLKYPEIIMLHANGHGQHFELRSLYKHRASTGLWRRLQQMAEVASQATSLQIFPKILPGTSLRKNVALNAQSSI